MSCLIRSKHFIPCAALLTSLTLTIYSTIYIARPGPNTYQSHFASVLLATCLAFTSVQLLIGNHKDGGVAGANAASLHGTSPRQIFVTLYWMIVTIAGVTCAFASMVIPTTRDERVIQQLLISLVGSTGLYRLLPRQSAEIHQLANGSGDESEDDEEMPLLQVDSPVLTPLVGRRNFWDTTLTIVNGLFLTIYAVVSILLIIGSIFLARTHRFDNPGELIHVTLPSGVSVDINVCCTYIPPANASSPKPTFWFESSIAHGVVDFLGVQTILAHSHARNSCSYDAPNFGWSSRLPASEIDFYSAFSPLLTALNRHDEEKVFVGWAGGIAPTLQHIDAAPGLARGLVLLDPAPYGIEWLDLQRENNWTRDAMLAYRDEDMRHRVWLAKMILLLGIPWGLLALLLPYNVSSYFDPSLYDRYRAQTMKEDMWAAQYFAIRRQAAEPWPLPEDSPVVAKGVATYAVMSYSSGHDEESSSFYREEKTKEASRLAGGKLTKPPLWCEDADCGLLPVAKAEWLADTLIMLGT